MECCVCLDAYDTDAHAPRATPCGHSLCSSCAERASSSDCPMCRAPLGCPLHDLPPSYALTEALHVIQLLQQQLQLAEQAAADEAAAAAAAAAPVPPLPLQQSPHRQQQQRPVRVRLYSLASPSSLCLCEHPAADFELPPADASGSGCAQALHGGHIGAVAAWLLQPVAVQAAASGLGISAASMRCLLLHSSTPCGRHASCYEDVTEHLLPSAGGLLLPSHPDGQPPNQQTNTPASSTARTAREGAAPYRALVLLDGRHPLPVLRVLLAGPWGAVGPRDVAVGFTWTFADLAEHVRQWLPEQHRAARLRLVASEERRPQPGVLLGCGDLPPRGHVCVLAAVAAPDMQLLAKTVTGKTTSLHVGAGWAVGDLKRAIHELEGFPPDMQRLCFACQQLDDDDRTLESYSVAAGSTIHVVLKRGGGGGGGGRR